MLWKYCGHIIYLFVTIVHVTNCEWWRKNGESMWKWYVVNHNLSCRIVVVKVMTFYVELELLIFKKIFKNKKAREMLYLQQIIGG